MKIQTSLVIPFALSLSLAVAQENGLSTPTIRIAPPEAESVRPIVVPPDSKEAALAPFAESVGADPYKGDNSPSPRERVSPPPAPKDRVIAPGFRQLDEEQANIDLDQARVELQAVSHETLSFCYEEFSLPLEVMVELQHKQLSDAALYEYVRQNLKSESQKDEIHRGTFAILRAKSGFPTSVKNNAVVVSPDSKTSGQVGYQLEVFYDGLKEISLRFSLMNTSLTGYTKEMREGKEVDKPLINEERIDATVTLSPNTSCLVGTMNRTSSNVSSGSGPRVILGFITASPVK